MRIHRICSAFIMVLAFSVPLSAAELPSWSYVYDIECGPDSVWCTLDGDLYLFDLDAGVVIEYPYESLGFSFGVKTIIRAPDNTLWFAGADTLLVCYDGISMSTHGASEFGIMQEEPPPIREVQFHNDETWLIFIDRLLQYSDEGAVYYQPPSSWPGMSGRPIRDFAMDAGDTVWTVGSAGLARTEPSDSTMVEDPRFRGMGYTLVIDEQGKFWIGGSRGLNYDASKEPTGWDDDPGGLVIIDGDTITRYTTENSALPSDRVFDLAFDESGTLWLCTLKGVATFDGESWYVYDGDDFWVFGLDNKDVWCIDIADDGTKWFGTNGYGMLRFDGTTWGRYIPAAGPMTAVEEGIAVPAAIELDPAFPNPFNPSTTISFTLPHAAPATLAVYNLAGQKVATLVEGPMGAGTHEIVFDDTGLASGVYVYRLETAGFSGSGKMLLVK